VATGETTPIVADPRGDIQYAEFAPTRDAIAFVRGNNVYLNNDGVVHQITTDGSPDLFHGVPDWVYEEEIFGNRSTLWFSPDATFIASLSFNETGIGTFSIPYYMDNQQVAPSYPRELDLRYPEVGSKNPTVALTLLDLGTGNWTEVDVTEAFPPDELIIGEVAWVTDMPSALVYRAYNRVQGLEKIFTVYVPLFHTQHHFQLYLQLHIRLRF
jgi:dipeptidyl-peptidase-4